MTETVIRGEVGDVIGREEIDQYIVPEAARYHVHDGEELAQIVPAERDSHPVDVLDAVPVLGQAIANLLFGILPRRWKPPANPTVIAPAGTFERGMTTEIVVEPVVEPDAPAADGEVLTYRFIESVPIDEREGIEWPTPSFDRPGENYFCAKCSGFVDPSEGDQEAALLIAARTSKLCAGCADELLDEIDGVADGGAES